MGVFSLFVNTCILSHCPQANMAMIWDKQLSWHDDVIKWNHFPRYWPFVRGIHRSQFPAQWPVTRSFGVFFDLRLNKRLSKQPRGWWFETPPWSLWRHRTDISSNWNLTHSMWTASRWKTKDLVDCKSSLDRVMAWCRQTKSHKLIGQRYRRSTKPYGAVV